MDSCTAPVHTRAMHEKLGFRFYAGLAGFTIALGIALLILFLVFSRAVYAWGAFGTLLVLAVVLLAFAWVMDRRSIRKYEAEEADLR
jgi:hypothetical protein